MSNIHNYPVESFTFADDDYYDIDFFNGSGYETRKIKGSTIKAGITAAFGNIYDSDGTLTANRILDGLGNAYSLTFRDLLSFTVTAGVDGNDNVTFNVDADQTVATNYGFKIRDVDTANVILGVKEGKVEINGNYYLPSVDGSDSMVIKTDGLGNTEFVLTQDLKSVNHSSTQWSKTIMTPVTLGGADEVANGFTFFTNADKVAGGTTSYDEYSIAYGLSITLSGTSGTANVNLDGVDYLATFNTSLYQTAVDFVSTHEAALNLNNIRVFALGSGTDGRLRFCAPQLILDAMTITNVTGDLSGSIANEFTGTTNSSPDHVLVPYVGTAYENQRLHHTFRVNFGIVGGSNQFYGLSLRRYADDTVIGSEIVVQRNNDVEGVQVTFASYTNGAADPFVIGGFYFALRNSTGQNVEIFDNIGILIQNEYQKLTQF